MSATIDGRPPPYLRDREQRFEARELDAFGLPDPDAGRFLGPRLWDLKPSPGRRPRAGFRQELTGRGLEAVAEHEAAHVALGYLVGGTVRSVEIGFDHGETTWDPPDNVSLEELRDRIAVSHAAGYAFNPNLPYAAYESDREAVRDAGGLSWDEAVEEARRLFSLPGMRRVTGYLAGHLMQRRHLSGPEFSELLDVRSESWPDGTRCRWCDQPMTRKNTCPRSMCGVHSPRSRG